MKLAISFIAALAVLALSNAAPSPAGIYSKSKFFEGNLDQIQGAIIDINRAGNDLGRMEVKLDELVKKKASIFKAETALSNAVDSSVYENCTEGNCI